MLLVFISTALGILAFFSFGPPYFWGLFFAAPIFVFLFREEKFWKLILGVFIFKIILLIIVFYFVFEPLGFILSSFIFLGLPISVFFIKKGLKFLSENPPLPLAIKNKISNLFLLILLPLLWLFFENLWARYSFLPAYIGTVGNIFGNSPFLGLAAIAGLNSLSFFALLVNALIAKILINFAEKSFFKPSTLIVAIIVIIFVVSGWQVSEINLQKNSVYYNSRPHSLIVGLVSNNKEFDEELSIFKGEFFTNKEKELAALIINKKIDSLKADLQNKNLDLLILPEDMIDIEIWNDLDKEAWEKFGISNAGILIKVYRELASGLNAYLAATLTTIRNNKRYNSTLLFNKKGELVDLYDKSRLTIGGEYWPFGQWLPFYYDSPQGLIPDPDIDLESAVFNRAYQYTPGKRKVLKNEDLSFASLICIEIHYPNKVEIFKNLGGQFISHTSNNQWANPGLRDYLYLTNNLRKIEAVWLRTPILINGRYERAGIIKPDGTMESVNFESPSKNYGLFKGEIRY